MSVLGAELNSNTQSQSLGNLLVFFMNMQIYTVNI